MATLGGQLARSAASYSARTALVLEGIRSFAAEYVADYKLPGEPVLREEVPRNPSGKMLKHVIRKEPAVHQGDT